MTPTNSLASAARPTVLKPLRDTIVDAEALTFPRGKWSIGVNGQTYQQEAVITFADYQYTTYFGHGGFLCVARRRLTVGDWDVIRFADYKMGDHCDAHNVSVLGICPVDGTVHLSFDHHNDPLHYRRSVPGLATRPEEVPWAAESFGPTTDALVPGEVLENFTYPLFLTTPEGKLQMIYRLDYSADGDWYLAEYSGETGLWQTLGMFLSRAGTYGESHSRCAYPNPPRYDACGRLHITWCWRENLRLAGNHDYCYAYSEDRGRTWRNNAGALVAKLGATSEGRPLAIALDTPGIVFQPIPEAWGQMNVTTQYIDAKEQVHVVNWQNPLAAAAPTQDMNSWGYVHYWRDPAGAWHNVLLPFVGRKPQIVVTREGVGYLVFCKGAQLNYEHNVAEGRLCVAMGTEATGWSDWAIVWRSERDFIGEPLLDQDRWRGAEVLSIYVQEMPVTPGEPSALHVIDFATEGGGESHQHPH